LLPEGILGDDCGHTGLLPAHVTPITLRVRPVARDPKQRTKVLNTGGSPPVARFLPVSWLRVILKCGKMDTSGIEPDPSRKPSEDVLSERDNQLHHVPLERVWRSVEF